MKKAPPEISRRQALEKLAKCSVYTAPTVVTLLSSTASYAQGSGVNGTQCAGMDNRNPNMWPTAANTGGNSSMNVMDTVQDCGNVMA